MDGAYGCFGAVTLTTSFLARGTTSLSLCLVGQSLWSISVSTLNHTRDTVYRTKHKAFVKRLLYRDTP